LSIPIAILTPQGLKEAPYSANSLAEAAPFEPEGVYTIARTFNRDCVLMFDAHLDRLEESARLENIPLQLDRQALRAALRALIERSGYAESRFRITVPRAQPDQLYLSLEPFKPLPLELIQQGVRVATVPLARHNPSAKRTAWMIERKAAALPEGIYEGVLISAEGFLLEGLSSNFYAIMDGELRTAGEGVLSGIARRALLALAPNYLPVRLEPVHKSELWAIEEAFLTSASRGVVPIVMIDQQVIAEGKPGAQTMQLRQAYEAWAQAHLTPL
jgi:branched-chain amino acid aminotransferase